MSRDLQFLLSGTQCSTYINVVGQAYGHECSTCRGPGFPGGTGCFELSNEGSGN